MSERQPGWVRSELIPTDKFADRVNQKIDHYEKDERDHEKKAKAAWKNDRDSDKRDSEEALANEAFRQRIKMHKLLLKRYNYEVKESLKKTKIAFLAVIDALLGKTS